VAAMAASLLVAYFVFAAAAHYADRDSSVPHGVTR
jgi:hypothetical protein